MVSPGKRAQRSRREVRGDPVVEDSSPSRPSKRRKKAEDPPSEPAEEGDSSMQADQADQTDQTDQAEQADPANSNMEDDEQIVTQVTQHLISPETPVQASQDHSNSIHESNKDGVKAYAKIAALDWTYYVTKLVVNIGRSSDPTQRRVEPDLAADDSQDTAVHIDLGPSKLISREHASIFFNSNEAKWWLKVKGRNALKVNGTSWKPTDAGPLESGDVIEIGGVEMMFVLPPELSPLRVGKQYLERANLTRLVASKASRLVRHPLPSGDSHRSPSSPGKSQRSQGSQRSLAPAPPDYKRPGTPPSMRARLAATKSPHAELSGSPLMLSNNDLDLSLDENRHIKPQYSYAQMITQAIMSTEEEKLNLSGIYTFILSRYSYYRNQTPSGWQNSIRHNLSLNKAFIKVPRSSDEPGKGMKWQLAADSRDEMIHSAYRGGRGGHRGSSNPSSPSQLNYITQGPKDMAARDPVSARKRKVSPSGSPQPRSALRDSHLTPIRGGRKPLPDEARSDMGADGSPLPRLRKPNTSSTLGMVENAPGSPTLTSSYLQEDGGSFVTPAPHRVHPKLAPPSTAQRPSQHMPTSSPAPFWKYADYVTTPRKIVQLDLSPSKVLEGLPPQSSSPAPAPSKSPVASPTRAGRATADEPPSPDEAMDEDGGIDLTKGFQSIGSYHAPVGQGKQVRPAANGEPAAGSGA